jgi:hypothetical protein
MTEMPPNASSSSPTEGAPSPSEPEPPDYAGRFLKGCGCLVASVVLAVGVALAGNGDKASWGSGIIGIMFLILVVGSSGLTGFWNKK